MDTSETYIKLCEQATEIQKIWGYRKGDWYSDKYYKNWGATVIDSDIEDAYIGDHFVYKKSVITDLERDGAIWLPRQDQLQGMIVLNYGRELHFALRFNPDNTYMVWECDAGQYECYGTSAEQLWLAFVMKEKYGKVWNGGDWING